MMKEKKTKRAVITGVGVVSPLGFGKEENWEALKAGKSGLSNITLFDPAPFPVKSAGEVRNFDLSQYGIDRRILKLTFRNVHLALAAAKMAFTDAGLTIGMVDPPRFGAVIGSGNGGFEDGPGFEDSVEILKKSWNENHEKFDVHRFGDFLEGGIYPLFLIKTLPNNAFFYISSLYKIQGENNNLISPFTGGSQAIGDAARSIQRGDAEVMMAGGYDTLIFPGTIFSYHSLNLLSTRGGAQGIFSPFDLKRDGFLLGEGAGMVIIEEYSHAVKRNARIYAEVTGYRNTTTAYHLYQPCPHGSGIITAVESALQEAGIHAHDIDYINADGIATVESDRAETKAYKAVLGDDARRIPLSSTKSMTGHLGAASGAVELIYCILSMEHGMIPPTINYQTVDPECDLDYVPNQARAKEVNIALSVNQGLSGQTTALIIQRP
ncbi:MAG: beta-ketoacyl-[acyl-carrier-protein] synthase family protein [Proteobacteria bacterium]|nr:beta-ketoacyl-[acyl-carrier-protein] synthase family protein [Pseudomonadota bacterium]